MTEFSIEEKAKAYDEAIERAKDFIKGEVHYSLRKGENIMCWVFPELKESEDEKIRKTLIRFHKSTIDVDGIKGEDIIAWLENLNLIKANSPQLGEQKPFDYKDANIQQKDFAPKSVMEATKEKKIDNANKVEPKFHEGDWIIRSAKNFKHNTYIIKEIKDYYVCEDLKGRRVTFTFSDVHKNFKSWGISDAKDGDVLVDEDIDVIGIFEGIEGMCWHSKFYYSNTTKEFYGIDCGGSHQKEFVHPATKEQRDTLEKAMTDAGYTFDFEKKELKKLGQSEVTKMSDQEEIAEIPFGAKDSELQEATYYIPKGFHAEIDDDKVVIKKGEKPTAWSEEDEEYLRRAINATKDTYPMTAKWLKSLKQRIGG